MSRRNKYSVIWLLATITLFTHKDEFVKLTSLYTISEEENAKRGRPAGDEVTYLHFRAWSFFYL